MAGAFFAFLFTTAASTAKEPSNACEDVAGLSVLSSPTAPWKGAPLRVIFAVEKPFDGELSLIAPDGSVAAKSHERHGGPPYFWFAEVASPAAGDWQARLVRPGDPPNARHSHAKSRSWATSRRAQVERATPSGPCAIAGTAERKTCIPPGSKSCSTRHSTPRLPGLPCMRCCATARATSCSIIWASARTAWGWSSGPTAPTCPTSCAPISRSRWDCRSATRSARAAAAASLPDAARGLAFKIPRPPRPAAPSSPRCSRLHQSAAGHASRAAAAATSGERARAEAAWARRGVRPLSANRRRRGPFRVRAHGSGRRKQRSLSRAAEAGQRCGRAPYTPIPTATF